MIHPINLTTIKETIELFNFAVNNSDLEDSLFEHVIKKKIDKINLSFNRIIPSRRYKRWESLGKAWKYVSGSPDADDLKVINSSINSLTIENNNQIHINNVFEKRMNNLTRTFNFLVDNEQNLENVTFKSFDSLNFVFKLDELLYYLEVVEESITLARRSIPSSRIILGHELEAIHQTLNNSGFGLNSVDSILNIASAYAMFNKDTFIYILKIPRIKDIPYTLSFIEPIIADGYRIHLPAQYYLKGQTSFISRTPCSKLKALFVCSRSNLEPLTECLQQLTSGKTSSCPMERIYEGKTIRKIDDGNIVIHGDNITLTSNCSVTRFLSGSYLIQHPNCTLKLDNEEYTSTDLDIQPFAPTIGIKVNPTKVLNHIPLKHLQELHLEHRNHIELLNLTTKNIHWKLNIFGWMSSALATTFLVFILGTAIAIIMKLFFWKTLFASTIPEGTRRKSSSPTEVHPESRSIPLIPQ